MIKHLELSTPTSCLNQAAPDEPVFVLRAKDPLAARVVRIWATLTEGGFHERRRVRTARQLADQMDAWRVWQSVKE